jgi:probable HAF family extracellular repeat protein
LLRRAALIGCLLATVIGAPARAATVTATPLPLPPGATAGAVSDINNPGASVGYVTIAGVDHAIRWSDGGYTVLPTPAGAPSASAARINDAGLAVGTLSTISQGGTAFERWLPDGTSGGCPIRTGVALGVLDINASGDALGTAVSAGRSFYGVVCHPDGTTTEPSQTLSVYAISDDGRVAGAELSSQTSFAWAPVTFNAGTGAITILPLPSGQTGQAYDLGPGDEVVGELGSTVPPSFTPRVGAIWSGGQITELGTLGGATSQVASTGRAVSASGDIIGTSLTAAGQTHGFIWRGGTMTDLGTLGGASSTPTAINDQGQVVGYSDTASGERHAFLWSDGQLTDLGAGAAVDINNSGQIIGSRGDTPTLWTVT